jgi:type IV pilus assembly protein PilM
MPAFVGVDLGTTAVRAVQVTVTGRGPAVLDRVGQVMLPAGAVRDGEVQQPEVVAEALRTLWSKWGFKGRKIALGVANQQVVVRHVDLPYLPEDELRRSLSFQVGDYIPIPVEQAVLDFHVLETYETDDGQQLSRLLLVAAQQEMVNAIIDSVRKAKLDPVMVDLDAFAMLRALAPEGVIEDRGGELLIDIGGSVTNILVHEGGVPKFVRILLMGGHAITDTLVSGMGMTFEDAENLKASTGLVDQDGDTIDEPTRVISERGMRFVDEIRGSLDYYAAQVDSIPVRRALITGGASLLPNLQERLADALRVPVDRGHPFQELKIGKTGLSNDELVEAEPYMTVAVGLALGAAE